eukprot:5555070-Alexandrium_andersonii.AAC.1
MRSRCALEGAGGHALASTAAVLVVDLADHAVAMWELRVIGGEALADIGGFGSGRGRSFWLGRRTAAALREQWLTQVGGE